MQYLKNYSRCDHHLESVSICSLVFGDRTNVFNSPPSKGYPRAWLASRKLGRNIYRRGWPPQESTKLHSDARLLSGCLCFIFVLPELSPQCQSSRPSMFPLLSCSFLFSLLSFNFLCLFYHYFSSSLLSLKEVSPKDTVCLVWEFSMQDPHERWNYFRLPNYTSSQIFVFSFHF